MIIDATNKYYKQLNEEIKHTQTHDITVKNVLGQRYIGTGVKDKKMTVYGTPGNAMGAYLDNIDIEVFGNAQDAVGDTMNAGRIVVHGSIGDAAGYAMRGGEIYVEGDSGYRTGVHMKAYREKRPVIVIGGRTGSFLGEYQAGGLIVVLGLTDRKLRITGNFPCTGMHGGRVFFRSDGHDLILPSQVTAAPASEIDMEEILPYVDEYCRLFKKDLAEVLDHPFTVVAPDSHNPYNQLYVQN